MCVYLQPNPYIKDNSQITVSAFGQAIDGMVWIVPTDTNRNGSMCKVKIRPAKRRHTNIV